MEPVDAFGRRPKNGNEMLCHRTNLNVILAFVLLFKHCDNYVCSKLY